MRIEYFAGVDVDARLHDAAELIVDERQQRARDGRIPPDERRPVALQLATVFGDSPIVAGRFTGINNVTFAYFFLSGSMLACIAVDWYPGPKGRRLMLAILGGVLLVDVAPMWGADVGGALAGLPALALVAMGLGQWKVHWRTVALAVVGTVVLLALLGWLDLMRDSADRSM